MGFGGRHSGFKSSLQLCGFRYSAYLLCKIRIIIISTYRTVVRHVWDNMDKGEQLMLSLGIWQRFLCFPLLSYWLTPTPVLCDKLSPTEVELCHLGDNVLSLDVTVSFFSQWKEWREPWSTLNWCQACMTREQGKAAESPRAICPRNGIPLFSILWAGQNLERRLRF